jgi:AraC family transcriptional regulator, transcriptional activator of pobA
MKWQFEDRSTEGLIMMKVQDPTLKGEGFVNGQRERERLSTFVFNRAKDQKVIIDDIAYLMPARTALPLVANQHFIFERPEELNAWQFNRDFYCIADHDAEVGCVGFLFHGIHHPMFIELSDEDLASLTLSEQLFIEDISMKDNMQAEMLRSLLKRLIIRITRLAKKQTENYQRFTDEKMDLVRKFRLLLEVYYKKEHEVQFYAGAMNKSPKTLTNLFRMCNYPSPSVLIQNRIILEAKRYLHYTDKSAKEIAYELGFMSAAHFSRFFKQRTGSNISVFKNTGSNKKASHE